MRRTVLLVTAAVTLGAVTMPPAAAEPSWGARTSATAPVPGFAPYDMVRRAADIVTAARASLTGGPSAPRVRDVVYRIDYPEKKDSISLSNSGMVYALQSTLLFPKDSAQLKPGAGKELGLFAKKIKSIKSLEDVQVGGYTDNLGSEEHGLTLSRARANAVKKVMEKQAPGVTFTARGFGEKNPVADNASEEGRVKNRRVVLSVKVENIRPAPGSGAGR